MAKKKDEKDVLVVRDEKTGEISVVAGLNADGTPKRTPAKAENAQSFLQFDRHGDVLDNFWKSHSTLTLLATQDLPTFLYYMIDPLKSWCWGAILFYPFKNSRFS